MNKIIFFIFSCLIFGLSGCEQKIDTWSGKDVAYVDMEADSTLVSFIYINTDVDTVQVRVQVMGNIPIRSTILRSWYSLLSDRILAARSLE